MKAPVRLFLVLLRHYTSLQ